MIFPNHPEPSIKYGDTGTEVETMQAALNVVFAKYPVYDYLEEDGVFGNKTDNAVRCFQQHVGLTQDGVVGRYTWIAIFALANVFAEP